MKDAQPPLPFGITLDQARVRRDEALAAVAAAAPDGWGEHAYELLVWFAERCEYVHPPAFLVWAIGNGLPVPPEARAIGPVIQRAARAGLLQRTSVFLPSPSSHASPKMLWRSAAYIGRRTGHYCGTRVEDVAA